MKKSINILLVIICLVSSFFAKAQGLKSIIDSSSDDVKLELIDENEKDLILIPINLALTIDAITKKLNDDNSNLEAIKNEIKEELKTALMHKEVNFCKLAGSFYSSESQGIQKTIEKCQDELSNPTNFNEIVTDHTSIEDLQSKYSKYLYGVISGSIFDIRF